MYVNEDSCPKFFSYIVISYVQSWICSEVDGKGNLHWKSKNGKCPWLKLTVQSKGAVTGMATWLQTFLTWCLGTLNRDRWAVVSVKTILLPSLPLWVALCISWLFRRHVFVTWDSILMNSRKDFTQVSVTEQRLESLFSAQLRLFVRVCGISSVAYVCANFSVTYMRCCMYISLLQYNVFL